MIDPIKIHYHRAAFQNGIYHPILIDANLYLHHDRSNLYSYHDIVNTIMIEPHFLLDLQSI